VNWFAPNISGVIPKVRDELLLAILSRSLTVHAHLVEYLRNLCLIPCSPDGVIFRSPSELIDPTCEEAHLYLEDEKKFPLGVFWEREEVRLALKKLGMRSTGCFTWEDVIERSQTVEPLDKNNHVEARRRSKAIIKLMNSLCERKEACLPEQKDLLKQIPFLLVESRPASYPIQWYADQHKDQRVIAVANSYPSDCSLIVGSQSFIVDHTLTITSHTAAFLSLSLTPLLSMVTEQLDLAISALQGSATPSAVTSMIKKLYKELHSRYCNQESIIIQSLANKAWIVIDGHVMKSCQLAFGWGKRAPPYLSEVPRDLSFMRELLEATGVKQNFEPLDFVHALKQIESESRGERLSEILFDYVARLIIPEFSKLSKIDLEKFRGDSEVPLLSKAGNLLPASALAYNDAPWMGEMEEHVEVHQVVTRAVAEGLGVKLVREKILDRYARDIPGRPFGQSEPLTRRLNSILKEYPAGEEILKEILQNADDAGATELHLIFDQRTYNTRRVFSDKWKSLQGPAVCVYNNRPFTDADIEGIQNLGRGGKREDPSSIGQYGIGFNAVYHLTDCPAFLSDNQTLCVLDPHCRYVPGADVEKPGRLYDTNTKFWNDFSDIQECFNSFGGVIVLDGGTLFRFPLRTEGVESNISKEVFDSDRVLKLFALFKESAPDMLLFLNSVNCIKLSVFNERSHIIDSYEVTANVSSTAKEARLKMTDSVAESKGKPTASIMYNSTFYTLDVSGKSSNSQHNIIARQWLVHQSIGIPHPDTSTSFTDGCTMALLPRVGIAAPIMQSLNRTNLFCFLPLPFGWKLPVQVNGHFALQSNRRGLWEDSPQAHSVRHKWNEDLVKFILAPAYAKFLLEARQYVNADENQYAADNGRSHRLETKLGWFHGLLPKVTSLRTGYSNLLWKEFYGYIVQHKLPLLASTGRPSRPLSALLGTFTEDEKRRLDVIFPRTAGWKGPSQTLQWLEVGKRLPLGLLKAYFWQCELQSPDKYILEELLFRLGYPLVSSPSFLLRSIKEVDDSADVEYVSPQSVLLFLKEYKNIGSCSLNLAKVEDTVFLTTGAVALVLGYLLPSITSRSVNSQQSAVPSESGVNQLNGLPLLVTADSQLKEFSTSPAAFLSRFSKLLPKQLDLFVHSNLLTPLLRVPSEDPVLKKLHPSDIICHLPHQDVFPADWLQATQYLEDWNPTVGPSKEWIELLWSFLSREDLNAALACLKDLPIIPANGGRILIPPSLSYTVFSQLSSRSSVYEDPELCKVLLKLGAVQVDSCITKHVSAYSFGNESPRSEFISKWFATLGQPLSVVKALQYLFTNRHAKIKTNSDAETILNYFQGRISSTVSFVSELKELPLFETVQGTLTDLPPFQDSYTLSSELPVAGSEVWIAEAKCTFLKQKVLFEKIYEKLGLNNKANNRVYVDYILPYFPAMSQDDRITHLVFLMKKYRPLETALVQALKDTACFDKQGRPAKISEFYDPCVCLFTLMLPEEVFPPTPALSERYRDDWLPFLRGLGLKSVCSKSEFLDFCERMEKETLTWQPVGQEPVCFSEWKKKSKEMVDHLLNSLSDHWYDRGFMQRISKAKFLPSSPVNEHSKQLAIPYYEQDAASRYATSYCEGVHWSEENEKLCWTSQALLRSSRRIEYKKLQSFRDAIGLQMQPNLESVLIHFSLLVEGAMQLIRPNQDVDDSSTVQRLVETLTVIFSFLSKHIADKSREELSPFADLRNSTSLSEGLSNDGIRIVTFLVSFRCVFLPNRQMFVKPHQVVFSLEDEFYPYVFQLPHDFAQHHLLWKRVGVDAKVRPFHCARVLEALKEKYGDNPIKSPTDEKTLIAVVYGLFETLKHLMKPLTTGRSNNQFTEQEIELALQPLYLPSRDLTLHLSSKLIFLNRPSLEKHVDSLQYKFLIDLIDLSSLEEETVNLLPTELRPLRLSDLTEEVLDPECLSVGDDQQEQSDVAVVYQDRYSSPLFAQGVRSIYIDHTRNRNFPAEMEKGLSLLKNDFRVVCLPQIRTCLKPREGGKLMKLDDSSKCCFLEHSESKATLYLETLSAMKSQGSSANMKFYGFIARELQALLHSQLPEFPMMTIVSCSTVKLMSTLKGLNIPFVHDGENPETLKYKLDYRPGMDLLPDHLALLRQCPLGYRFNVDEWVAYETSENHFIYAVILYQEIGNDETSSEMLTRYGIDIGEEEPKVVGVLNLYAFIVDEEKEPDEPERNLVVCDSVSAASTNGDSKTLAEKKEVVRKQLQEIWKLPDNERKQAIRRLYLQWHPDKSDDVDAEEVFKFLMNEIQRLERGDDSSGVYSSCYSRWNSYAGSSRRRRRGRGGCGASSSSSGAHWYQAPPSSYSECQTQPEKTKGYRFVEQAEVDLSAAECLFEGGNRDSRLYALVCFHCHEVAEKALKGILFIHRGISFDRQRKHHIGFFLGAADLPGCPGSLKRYASDISDSYYLDTRYPDQRNAGFSYDEEEANRALKAAQGVVRDTRSFVGY
jgi:sacsin